MLIVAPVVAVLNLKVVAAQVAEETYTWRHAAERIAGEGRLPVGESVAFLACQTGMGLWLSTLLGLLELAIFGFELPDSLLEQLNVLVELDLAAVLWDLGPIGQHRLAKVALKLYTGAFNTKMLGQTVPIVETLLGAATIVGLRCVDAFKFNAARLPVRLAHLVFEGGFALVALEVRVVQLLHDKAIHIFAQA